MKRLYAVARATAIVLCLYGTGLSAELSTESQGKLMKSVDSYASRMSEVALKIWSAPELGYLETKTQRSSKTSSGKPALKSRQAWPAFRLPLSRARGQATVQ